MTPTNEREADAAVLVNYAGYFRRLFSISIAKHVLTTCEMPADFRLRFLEVIDRLARDSYLDIAPAAVAAVAPACDTAVKIFREAQRSGDPGMIDRPEVREILATLNPSIVDAIRLCGAGQS